MTRLNIKQRCHVKKDTEIRLYLQERRKGMTQRVAAARAGIGERTARTYEQAAALPSQLKRLHDWKTRIDPFEEDWLWVVSQLERDPALQGSTLFALLCERQPEGEGHKMAREHEVVPQYVTEALPIKRIKSPSAMDC